MVEKTIDTKAKAAFQLCFSNKKIDQNCPCGNQPANSTVAKSQSSTMKDLWVEKPKVQDLELLSSFQCLNNNKLSKKVWKEKKKEQYQRDQKCQKGSTLATRVNTAQTNKLYQKNKNRDCLDKTLHDSSLIQYYSYQKLDH